MISVYGGLDQMMSTRLGISYSPEGSVITRLITTMLGFYDLFMISFQIIINSLTKMYTKKTQKLELFINV